VAPIPRAPTAPIICSSRNLTLRTPPRRLKPSDTRSGEQTLSNVRMGTIRPDRTLARDTAQWLSKIAVRKATSR
jgi:hypothetical protein